MESAAVFVLAELKRNKGGGLLTRQPQESITFIAKIGYPLWLFPQKNSVLVFDGLNASLHSVSYGEAPSALVFMENLLANQRPRENYVTFLSDNINYFQQSPKDKHFNLQGLIATEDFKFEFNTYRREAIEITAPSPLLLPILEERDISGTLAELDKLQAFLKTDEEKLSESLRLLNKTTSQYLTELEYEAAATKEEIDAKIKAQEEFINPQLARICREYSQKIKGVAEGYDKELGSLYKLREKAQRYIQHDEAKIRQYEQQAKIQGKKGHEIYEKSWKEKVKRTEKEISGLRKELKNTENNINKISEQKGVEISRLNFEREAEIKLVRQPIIELEALRNEKMLVSRQESNKLLSMEKTIVGGIEKSLRLRETINRGFEGLGISSHQLKNPALFFVLFYVVCYKVGLDRRYLCIPPSTVNSIDFSSKLKGVFGMSKIKDLLASRFKTVATLIGKVEAFARQNSVFENQLWSLGDKNNLLKNSNFLANVERGLVLLKNEGWLSERETSEFTDKVRF